MAHELDMSNGRANMAFIGTTPWHELGFELKPGASIDVWKKEAGLAWEAKRSPVHFFDEKGKDIDWEAQHVLYRSDTRQPLSIVSKDYNIVQPGDILQFFSQLSLAGGFDLETAGSLFGGRRIWALAKVDKGAPVVKKDIVKPYVLLATSFDGTLATTARFTTIRVVCNNTLSASLGGKDGKHAEAGEQIKIYHSEKFDPEVVRKQLGIFKDEWEKFQILAGMLVKRKFDEKKMDAFLVDLLSPYSRDEERDIRESKGYVQIMSLFKGGAIGSELAGQTAWGAVNAVTEYVDHHRGTSANTRLKNAWFGRGNELKTRAAELALAA